jgi:hypothetical protein
MALKRKQPNSKNRTAPTGMNTDSTGRRIVKVVRPTTATTTRTNIKRAVELANQRNGGLNNYARSVNAQFNTLNNQQKNTVRTVLRGLASLRNNLGTRSGTAAINVRQTVRNALSRVQKREKSILRKETVKIPWYIVNLSTQQVVPITVWSNRKQWNLNWHNNARFFPAVKIRQKTTNASQENVNFTVVGALCNNNVGSNLQQMCRKKSQYERYMYMRSGKVYKFFKNGLSGIGVPQLASTITGIGKTNATNKPALKRALFSMKRTGDYGQVFSCLSVNRNSNMYIMKPGDLQIAKQIRDKSLDEAKASIPRLKQIFDLHKYYFKQTVFWSSDRPALLCALLMGVPIVRDKKASPTQFLFVPNITNEKSTIASLYRNKNDPVYINIIGPWAASAWDPLSSGTPPNWFFALCFLDSAHDFGHGDRVTSVTTFQQRTMFKNVLKQGNPGLDAIWSGIVTHEDNIGTFIEDIAISRGGVYDKIDSEYERMYTEKFKPTVSCIVYDTGSTPKGPLKDLVTLLSAKIYDPSTS